MEVPEELQKNLARRRKVLFDKNSPFLQDLAALLRETSHRAAVLWALELAEETVCLLEEKYPDEPRPREALLAARAWTAGKVKMRFAQQKILACHALAKELASAEDVALCHAVGQACAVVHTAGHALGYPVYELTAIVRRCGAENCQKALEKRKGEYIARLLYWRAHWRECGGPWASFLQEQGI